DDSKSLAAVPSWRMIFRHSGTAVADDARQKKGVLVRDSKNFELGSGLRARLGATSYGGALQRWDFRCSETVIR
ncbi:hypothetical protein HAX54_029403, partial [Datura stramonium]|nr:hypothetical protein [Datura stramonium]